MRVATTVFAASAPGLLARRRITTSRGSSVLWQRSEVVGNPAMDRHECRHGLVYACVALVLVMAGCSSDPDPAVPDAQAGRPPADTASSGQAESWVDEAFLQEM